MPTLRISKTNRKQLEHMRMTSSCKCISCFKLFVIEAYWSLNFIYFMISCCMMFPVVLFCRVGILAKWRHDARRWRCRDVPGIFQGSSRDPVLCLKRHSWCVSFVNCMYVSLKIQSLRQGLLKHHAFSAFPPESINRPPDRNFRMFFRWESVFGHVLYGFSVTICALPETCLLPSWCWVPFARCTTSSARRRIASIVLGVPVGF